MEPDPNAANQTMTAGFPSARTFASGRYTVRRTLGEGGQKVVYLVHDEALDRDCALSMVKAEMLESDDLERLRREAQAMARLGAHSNIVTVHDIGDEDGKPYLVCEYVPAGDLGLHLRDAAAPLTLERSLAIAADIARALAVAHGRGVIHRDVKPGNVWLCEDGSAKLGDFGLAFSIDRTRMTIPGTAIGTATYMAPEQARGEPADGRTDLYALGVMLYEMVCGLPPFTGDNPLSVISQHATVAPTAPVQHVEGLPPALNDLILRLLAKSPALRPASAAALGEELREITESLRTPVQPAMPELEELDNPPATPGFVGRRPELEQLAAALDRTTGGAGSLVMVVGEPGIGKTRLIEQFAARARDGGARVLTGRCYDGDWAPPFSPFVEAIKQHATITPPQRLQTQLGADAGVLARIVPALHERLPNIAEPPAIPAEGERYRLLEAVSDTLGRLAAERPLVLVLDDLHWADKGTIAMLQQVARMSAAQRVLVLGAYRDVELDRTHPLADALAGLRREKHFERIALRGLDGAEVAELLDVIAEQDVPPVLSEAIARETNGNPFFIKEVLLHLVEEGKIVQSDGTWTSKLSIAEMGIPEGVREVIGRRLSRVSETCGRMLTVCSALTAGFSWDVISAISDADSAALLDTIDEALSAQIIVERERGRYDFTHALIRHTLYDELSTPRRVLLHRQIGEALERLYRDDVEPHLAELAHHFSEAGSPADARKALEYAVQGAMDADRRSAHDMAVTQLRQAIDIAALLGEEARRRSAELLLALGEALWKSGDLIGSEKTYRLDAAAAQQGGFSDILASAALGLAGPPEFPRVGRDVFDPIADAIESLDPATQSAQLAMLLARLDLAIETPWAFTNEPPDLDAEILRLRERVRVHAPGSDLGAAALKLARDVDDSSVISYVLRARLRVQMEREAKGSDEVAAWTQELVDIGTRTDDKELLAWAIEWQAEQSFERGEVDQGSELMARHEALARLLKQPFHIWSVGLHRTRMFIRKGDWAAAERESLDSLAYGQQFNIPSVIWPFAIQLFAIRKDEGRLAELEPWLKSFSQQFPGVKMISAALAVSFVDQERVDEAASICLPLAADLGLIVRDQFRPVTMGMLAEIAAALGDASAAGSLYDALLPWHCRQYMVAGGAIYGSASRHLGMLAAVLQRYDDSEAHFEDALAMNTSMSAPPWVARTQHDYARMLLKRNATGDTARARLLLREALATAQEIGMTKVEADCKSLLAADRRV